MLLFLHESIEDYISSERADEEEVLVALENIAGGRYTGKHLVLGERPTLKAIASWSELGSTARTTYRKIYNESTQSYQLASRFSYRVDVVANDFGGLDSSTSASQIRIQVPVRHFRDNCIVQETMLLSENFRDTEIYEWMARFSARSLGFQSVHLRMSKLGGGGADVAEHYKRCQNEKNRFCICIVDSDRHFPGDRLKATAASVKAIDDENQPLCMYLYTHGHELENYIPTSWYKILVKDNPNKWPAVEFLERLENSSAREARKFLDMKSGLLLKQVLEAMERQKHPINGAYWQELLSIISEVTNDINRECLELQKCQNPGSCKCRAMVGFGKNVTGTIIALLNSPRGRRQLENALGSTTRADWEAMGGQVLAWCCGAQALYAA